MEGLLQNRFVQPLIIVCLLMVAASAYGQTPNPPTSFAAATQGSSSILLTWDPPSTGATPDAYLIVARKSGGTYPAVNDGTPVADDFDFTDPNTNGAYNSAHVAGPNAYLWTGLDPETLYEFTIYAYTNTTTPNYRNSGAPSTSARTLSIEPAAHAASFTATAIGAAQIDLAFSAASTITDADGYIIVRKTGSDPTIAGVTDGVSPGSLSLPGGTTLVTTISNSATTSFSDTGLNGLTDYHYILIPYNYNSSNSSTYNYKTDGSVPLANATTPAATVTITQLSGIPANISGSPLGSGTTNQAILGFSLSSDAATTFTGLNVQAVNPATPFTNVRLFRSTNGSFGGDTDIGATINLTGSEIQISGITESITSTATNYFLVVNVNTTVNNTTPAIQPSFDETNITMTGGTVTAVTITGLNYSFVDASPPGITFSPSNSATNISVATNITITFDEPVRNLDDSPISTVDLNTLVELKIGNNAGATVPFNASIDGANLVITVDPSSNLSGSTTYYVEINPVEDGNNNATSATNITFTTEAPPSITSVTPVGTTCSGETMTITGTNFNSPTVTINGVTATIVGSPNSTQIQITAPGGAAIGSFPVTVINGSGLSDNSSSYTIKPAIDPNMSVAPSNPGPATGQNFNILVGGATQNGVSYRVRRISPTVSSYSSTQSGNGGQLTFGPYSHGTPDTYVYEVQAQSGNCNSVTLTQTATVTIAALAANAGSDATLCAGETITLGGSPTASGGSGFYQITWTALPSDPSLTALKASSSNPQVSPTTTTTYTVSVKDDPSGTPVMDQITVTVNTPTPSGQLSMTLNPNNNGGVYSNQDAPVALSFNYTGPPPTGTGVFSGPGVNGTPGNYKFYPQAANIGQNTITLTYTNSVNCNTDIQMVVNVFDNSSNFTGFDDQYCDVSLEDPVTPTLAGYTLDQIRVWHYNFNTGIYVTDFVGITPTATPGQYTFNPKNAANGYMFNGSAFIYLEAMFHNNAVPLNTRSVYKYTFIYELPKVSVLGYPDDEVCKNGRSYKLSGSPAGGVWSGPGLTPAPGNDGNPSASNGEDGIAVFDPTTGVIGKNVSTYTFMDIHGCQSSQKDSIDVKNIPAIDFSFADGCERDTISFIPSQTLPPGVTISQYLWAFGDNTLARQTSFTNPTLKSYDVASNYDVSLTAEASNGCIVTSSSKEITIGEIPDVTFTWANVCEGDATLFSGSVSGLGTSVLQAVEWDFTESGYGPPGPPAQLIRSYTYSSGMRNVKLRVTTEKNCSNEAGQFVYTVPKVGALEFPYEERFDLDDGKWITGTSDTTASSWQWGVPANTLINADASGSGSAWVTNLTGTYNTNENSWIHSPCFDLTQIQRPILQLDIRSLTPNGIDGAVIQYNSKSTTNVESDWKTLGKPNDGDNWYNEGGILSNPGNQALNQYGWTGPADSINWRSAKIPLDDIITIIPPAQQDKVRFRVAFASSSFNAVREGFAVDNFDIHQRDRLVLVEHFTNSGGTNSGTDANKIANTDLNTFVDARQGEVVKLEYHTGLGGPGADPIYLDNRTDANARTAYYGVTATPSTIIDGNRGIFASLYDQETLKGAEVSIDTIFTTGTPSDQLNIEVQFTALKDLPANTVLHVAVIEKEITETSAMGSNGESSFVYVMKKMLPSALGTKFTAPLADGTTQTINVSWKPKAYDFNQLAIIVFLQNEDTKVIYQTRLLENPQNIPDPGIVTGLEPSFGDQILVYPNPADQNVLVKLPVAVPADIGVRLLDSFGREIFTNTFDKKKQSMEIKTADLATGIYILTVEKRDGVLTRKKIMVSHP